MTNNELREIYRVLPDGNEARVRMSEIKTGDRFRVQAAPDDHPSEFCQRIFEAAADARLINDVWGVAVQWD